MPLFRRNNNTNNARNAPVLGRNNNTNNSRNAPVLGSPAMNPANASTPEQFQQQAASLIPAEVRMISGCHSEQTSADVSNVSQVSQLPHPAGRAGGACTSALLELLYRHHRQGNNRLSFQQVLLELRQSLSSKGFDQIPQLTSSRPLELSETPFTLVGGAGVRRAVLVGINYRGQDGQLTGCHNDVFNVKRYIMEAHGYEEHNILVLVDDGVHYPPTRQTMVMALRQLVAQSVAGDSVYFHYSGHGGLLEPVGNLFKINSKGYDETLYPLDHQQSGQIRDFNLFNNFVKPMAAGVTVTCVFDCCHSGTVLELPYSFQPTPGGQIRMRQSMDSLTNLAFLYLLAGGMFPPGFYNVASNIEDVTGGSVEDFQGAGMEDAGMDGVDNYYNDDDDDGAAGVGDTTVEDGDGDGYGEVADDVARGDVNYDQDDTFDAARGYDDNNIAAADYGGDAGGDAFGGAADYADGGDAFGGTDFSGWTAGDGDDDNGGGVDCGCVQDVLGALMDGGE